jgi:hypothetical protein
MHHPKRVDAVGPAGVPGLRTDSPCPAAVAVGEAGLRPR